VLFEESGGPRRKEKDAKGEKEMSEREPWRLLLTWDGEPGWNMALDEALLGSADPRPTLRFYTWKPHALSLGYFQRFAELEPLAEDRVLVRRFSGGGAIHHADELTLSLAAPAGHALFRGEVRRSYERIHGLLAHAFADLGVQARLRGASELRSDRAESGMCFHRSTPIDLVWDGRKGVGSAQRRSSGRVLHHGSIKLGASALEDGVAELWTHAPRLAPSALARALEATFERELGCAFSREEPGPAELEHAAARAPFFRSEAFVRRR
jgi:lipoate-protein ligase A